LAGLARALKRRFLRFRREIIVVAYAAGNPATPWRLRLAGLGLIVYLLIPVDLIPIFVPVVGLLDDLLIVPWGLSTVVRRLPPESRTEAEARAARFIDRFVARPIRFLVILVVVLVVFWGVFLWLVWRILMG